MMRRSFFMISSLITSSVVGTSCSAPVEPKPQPSVIHPRFDPRPADGSPPVVPSPNDLAAGPDGFLAISPTTDPSWTDADRQLVGYLNMLNGYPTSSLAKVTFSGPLKAESLGENTLRVIDLTTGQAVTGLQRTYSAPGIAGPFATYTLANPNGWAEGHTYAFAAVGGPEGLKGEEGQSVVGTPVWAFMRMEKPMLLCSDATLGPEACLAHCQALGEQAYPSCRPGTDLLPSTLPQGTAERLREQVATAIALEPFRLKYKPTVDLFVSRGVPRSNLALLWTFRVADLAQVAFQPELVPPRVPSPNDLAIDPVTGLVNAPINPAASPAEQEFLRDYINTLTGFPTVSSATVSLLFPAGGNLDPATLTPQTLRFFESVKQPDGTVRIIDAPELEPGVPLQPVVTYDAASGKISLAPPGGAWPKGRTFGAALITPTTGSTEPSIHTTDGGLFVPTVVWGLLQSSASLVACPNDDLSHADCTSAVTLSPVATADALRLEKIRRSYQPYFDHFTSNAASGGNSRRNIGVLWLFSILSQPEMFFDPTTSVVPFPNDLIRTPATPTRPAQVSLPIPDGGSASEIAIITGLNELDGFSTTGTILSELDEAKATLDFGTADPASLTTAAGFFALDPAATAPAVEVCFNCDSTKLRDGGVPTSPQQLQVVPRAPLEEQETYAGYVTRALRSTAGAEVIPTAAFALLRSSQPLVDANGKSTVSLIDDARARQAEPARLTLKPVLDALEARGIPRRQVALAWGLTTQSTRQPLAAFYAVPGASNTPVAVSAVTDRTQVYKLGTPFPAGNIGAIHSGNLTLSNVLTGLGGVADLSRPRLEEAPFLYVTPTTAAPATGYPVVIWGHPITASGLSILGIANALAAQGYATISVDLPWHGERSTCIGSAGSLSLPDATNDDAACVAGASCNVSTGKCNRTTTGGSICTPGVVGDALCLNNNEGYCIPDAIPLTGRCQGGTWVINPATNAPVVSGWNFIGGNLFANRDHFRQHAVDLAQVERVIAATGTGSLAAAVGARKPDPESVHYVGMSLGGILGLASTSVSPRIHGVVANASGSDLPSLLLEGLRPEARESFLDQVEANAGLTRGTPGFDFFINIFRWVMDPADPANHAPYLIGSGFPPDRRVLIQYIEGDPVIPNANTERVIRAANREGLPPAVSVIMNTADASLAGTDRHGYLLSQTHVPVRDAAQLEIVNFVKTGAVP